MLRRFGSIAVVAVSVLLLAGTAGAQTGISDTARVPVIINTDAVVTLTPPASAIGIEESVVRVRAGSADTLLISAAGATVPVSHQLRQRQNSHAAMRQRRGAVSLTLSAAAFQNADISLFAINGRRILRERVSAAKAVNGVKITRANIAAGLYLLSVKGAGGHTFSAKLTHTGGRLSINATFGNVGGAAQQAKGAANDPDAWTISFKATGHTDTTYQLPLVNGVNPAQVITLTPNYIMKTRNDTILTMDGKNKVHVIDSVTIAQRTHISETEIVIHAVLPHINVGDVIVAGAATESAPDGFFNRVKSVNISSGYTYIGIEPAFLTDVFGKLSIHEVFEIENAKTVYYDKNGNVRPAPPDGLQKSAADITLKHQVSLASTSYWDKEEGGKTSSINVTTSGSLSLTNKFFVNVVFDSTGLKNFEFNVTSTKAIDLTIGVNGTINLEKKWKLAGAESPLDITVPVGGVPVRFKPGFETGIRLTAQGSISLSKNLIDYKKTTKNGIKYTVDDGWKQINESSEDSGVEGKDYGPDVMLAGELSVGTYVEGYLKFYGRLSKVALTPEVFGKFSLDGKFTPPNPNPDVKLQASEGIAIGASVEFNLLFVKHKFEGSVTLLEKITGEKPIFPEFTYEIDTAATCGWVCPVRVEPIINEDYYFTSPKEHAMWIISSTRDSLPTDEERFDSLIYYEPKSVHSEDWKMSPHLYESETYYVYSKYITNWGTFRINKPVASFVTGDGWPRASLEDFKRPDMPRPEGAKRVSTRVEDHGRELRISFIGTSATAPSAAEWFFSNGCDKAHPSYDDWLKYHQNKTYGDGCFGDNTDHRCYFYWGEMNIFNQYITTQAVEYQGGRDPVDTTIYSGTLRIYTPGWNVPK